MQWPECAVCPGRCWLVFVCGQHQEIPTATAGRVSAVKSQWVSFWRQQAAGLPQGSTLVLFMAPFAWLQCECSCSSRTNLSTSKVPRVKCIIICCSCIQVVCALADGLAIPLFRSCYGSVYITCLTSQRDPVKVVINMHSHKVIYNTRLHVVHCTPRDYFVDQGPRFFGTLSTPQVCGTSPYRQPVSIN
jgi:hypothetical protein